MATIPDPVPTAQGPGNSRAGRAAELLADFKGSYELLLRASGHDWPEREWRAEWEKVRAAAPGCADISERASNEFSELLAHFGRGWISSQLLAAGGLPSDMTHDEVTNVRFLNKEVLDGIRELRRILVPESVPQSAIDAAEPLLRSIEGEVRQSLMFLGVRPLRMTVHHPSLLLTGDLLHDREIDSPAPRMVTAVNPSRIEIVEIGTHAEVIRRSVSSDSLKAPIHIWRGPFPCLLSGAASVSEIPAATWRDVRPGDHIVHPDHRREEVLKVSRFERMDQETVDTLIHYPGGHVEVWTNVARTHDEIRAAHVYRRDDIQTDGEALGVYTLPSEPSRNPALMRVDALVEAIERAVACRVQASSDAVSLDLARGALDPETGERMMREILLGLRQLHEQFAVPLRNAVRSLSYLAAGELITRGDDGRVVLFDSHDRMLVNDASDIRALLVRAHRELEVMWDRVPNADRETAEAVHWGRAAERTHSAFALEINNLLARFGTGSDPVHKDGPDSRERITSRFVDPDLLPETIRNPLLTELARAADAQRRDPGDPVLSAEGGVISKQTPALYEFLAESGAKFILAEQNGVRAGYAMYFEPARVPGWIRDVLARYDHEFPEPKAYIYIVLVDPEFKGSGAQRVILNAIAIHLQRTRSAIAVGGINEWNARSWFSNMREGFQPFLEDRPTAVTEDGDLTSWRGVYLVVNPWWTGRSDLFGRLVVHRTDEETLRAFMSRLGGASGEEVAERLREELSGLTEWIERDEAESSGAPGESRERMEAASRRNFLELVLDRYDSRPDVTNHLRGFDSGAEERTELWD